MPLASVEDLQTLLMEGALGRWVALDDRELASEATDDDSGVQMIGFGSDHQPPERDLPMSVGAAFFLAQLVTQTGHLILGLGEALGSGSSHGISPGG